MLTIPDEVKALFQTDGVHKNFHVHFPNGDTTDLNNENIVQESVQFTESLCSQQYFKFGLAEASQIEFTAVGIPNILGSTIECAIEIDCTSLGAAWASAHPVDPALDWLEPQTCMVDSKLYYRVPYGRFIVDSCPRDQSVMAQRKIVAYTESFFRDVTMLQGQFPNSTININPFDWLEANQLDSADMTLKQLTIPGNVVHQINLYTSNGSSVLYSISGILPAGLGGSGVVASFESGGSIMREPLGVYALRINYTPHEFDNYAIDLFNAFATAVPAGTFTYTLGYSSGSTYKYINAFKNTQEAIAAMARLFLPSFSIIAYYVKGIDDPVFERYSKPVFFIPNETYILDFLNLNSFEFYVGVPSGYTFDYLSLCVTVPSKWNRTSNINTGGSPISISGWSSAAPFGSESSVTRDGTVDVYYKMLTPNTVIPNINVKNTLEFTKGALGKYYTYSNAVSTLGIVGGLMELMGEFWKEHREGGSGRFQISANQTAIAISNSQWSEFWWDENEVEPIGLVKVQFADDESGEPAVASYIIGSGGSVYTMEDNDMMKNTSATEADVQTAIETYFEPNAAVVNFTPVDLKMKGLPYLEAGDKIELTADDGATVETYILEQTISGIQHLQADITSTNGELLEVTEE